MRRRNVALALPVQPSELVSTADGLHLSLIPVASQIGRALGAQHI